jgi:fructose-1-phosphate kinase PfkB-like protein
MKRILTLVAVATMGLAPMAHAGGGDSFAGGFAGGLAAGVVNGIIQAATQPKVVVVQQPTRTRVVHETRVVHTTRVVHDGAAKSASQEPRM